MNNCCQIGCLHPHQGPNLGRGVLVEEVLFSTQIHTANSSETGAENRMAHSLFSDQRNRDLWEFNSQIGFSASFRWRPRLYRRAEVKRTEFHREGGYSWAVWGQGCGLYTGLRGTPFQSLCGLFQLSRQLPVVMALVGVSFSMPIC